MEINKLCDLVFVSFGVFGGHEGFGLACPPAIRARVSIEAAATMGWLAAGNS